MTTPQRHVVDRRRASRGILGYEPGSTGDPDILVGLTAAQARLEARALDGANRSGGYADYAGYAPVNTPDTLVDPHRWQPLRPASGVTQQFALPRWGRVLPFALTSNDQFRPPSPVIFPAGLYHKQT